LSRQLTKEQQELAAENIRLTTELIKRNIGRSKLTYDEVYDASIDALISSAIHFKTELGYKFSTLYFIAGDKEIKKKLRNRKTKKRDGKTISLTFEMNNLLDYHDDYSFFNKESIRLALKNSGLNEKEMNCIYLYFYRNMSQNKTAKALGISQAHVGRLIDKGISKLRKYINEQE
jgi:RNA polymerase sigma factor (sigma-70 family)